MFAGLYPDETAGLVLVDAPHEGQVEGLFESHLLRWLDPGGFLPGLWQSDVLNELLAVDWEPLASLLGMESAYLRTLLGELTAFRESGAELRALGIRPEIPLVVIMHGIRVMPEGGLGDRMEQKWLELQRDLVSRHEHGTFIIAENSTHLIPFHEPELIVEAVQGLMNK
jgi:pimeloyl-ACP methyl ester carboxylesterase